MTSLTARQAAVLTFIQRHIAEQGYPPTLREIGRHMGISSTNGVNDHLRALERKGFLERADKTSRGMRVLEPATVLATDSPRVLELQRDRAELVRRLERLEAEIEVAKRADRIQRMERAMAASRIARARGADPLDVAVDAIVARRESAT